MRSISRCARTSANIRRFITGLELTDYRVRILNGGTEAVTRVLIESADETGEHWTTIGVSRQHHRCVVPGADGFDRLQAGEIRRAGVIAVFRRPLLATGDAWMQRGVAMIDHISIAVRDLESGGAVLRRAAGAARHDASCANGRMRRSASARNIRNSGSTSAPQHEAASPTTAACISACARPTRRRSMRFTPPRSRPAARPTARPGMRHAISRQLLRRFHPRPRRQPHRGGDVFEGREVETPLTARSPPAPPSSFPLRPRRARPRAASAECPRPCRRPENRRCIAAGTNSSVAHVLDQRQQRVPVAVDVGDQDRLLVAAELRPGELLDQLFERADAARQRDEARRRARTCVRLRSCMSRRDDQFLRAAAAAARAWSGIPG